MMGEVECKHVSICCWDGGDLQKEFSPWPSLPDASGCCPRLSRVTKTDTHGGIVGEASRLPDSVRQKTNQKLSSYEH